MTDVAALFDRAGPRRPLFRRPRRSGRDAHRGSYRRAIRPHRTHARNGDGGGRSAGATRPDRFAGTVATTGGRFFGFVVGGALPVTVAASWLASTWDQNAGTWILSPIGAEAQGLEAAGYEVLNEVVLNQVVFACPDEKDTRAALAKIQASGVTWVGPTHWRGRYAMRISVSSWATTEADVDRSLKAMADAFCGG